MLRTLRRNQQFFILLILIYGILAVLGSYFTPQKSHLASSIFSSPFIQGWYSSLINEQRFIALFLILIYAILLIAAFNLTRLVVNYQMVSSRSQFTAIFYLAISTITLPVAFNSSALFAAPILVFVLERIVGSIDQRGNSFRFVEAGVLLAIGGFFYLNLLFLFPFLWFSQLILRPPSWREMAYSLIGLLIPVIYLLAGAYINDVNIPEAWRNLQNWVALGKAFQWDMELTFIFSCYGLVIIMASLFTLRKYTTAKIQVRRLLQLLFILFLNILLLAVLVPSIGNEIFFLLAVPTSVLLAVYYTECRPSLVNSIVFSILLLLPLAYNYYGLIAELV